MKDYWKTRPLMIVKNLNIETMKECFVISTLLDDGSAAKLGDSSGMLEFKTRELAENFITELRGDAS